MIGAKMTISEIKKEIKRLKNSVKDFKPRSKERKETKLKILELKEQLKNIKLEKDEKRPIIDEILKLDKEMANIRIDLTKHSIADLKKYLNKLKENK